MPGNPLIRPPKGPRAVTIHDPINTPPTVDAIHPSEDVVHPSESGSLAKSKGIKEMGLEQQERVDKVGEGSGVLKSLIPASPKPGWPSWAVDYLKSMLCTRTDGAAAIKIGITFRSVYEVRMQLADFDAAVEACRKYRDSLIVSDLEDVMLKRAIKGDPKDRMSASLGMFHAKARDDKYKDKFSGAGGINIQIVMGHPIVRKPANNAVGGVIIDAEEG